MFDLSAGRLPWLRVAPSDFRNKIKTLKSQDSAIDATQLREIASFDLDINKLTALDRAVEALPSDKLDRSSFGEIRLAYLAQATTDYSAPALRASALRHGLLVQTYVPAYGQAMAEVMDPSSALRGFDADMALIAETPQSLGLTQCFVDNVAGEAAVMAAIRHLTTLVEGLQNAGVRTVILQTIPLPSDSWTGSYDRRSKGALSTQIALVNEAMVALCDSHATILFDVDQIAASVGRSLWHDTALWHRAKVPFALEFMPLYGEKLGHLLAALKGKSKKCLVLDLDNTCWGGIIGDDGLEGIQIGQGSAQGEAFLAIQRYALSLKERGIVLAVCSKNEESNAKLPFEKHPDMALRLDDIAVFVANWADKASNIAHIAKVLNIGVDALVFLDDNPAERARVRQELPQVSVPEVGDDAVFYPSMLAQGGYFDTIGLSADDAKRAEQYRSNAQRAVALETIGNYEDYLKSLEMVCTIAPFDQTGRTRIAQLINKSNQFHLTTRRYTEAEVAQMQDDPKYFTMQTRLTDKFGDNGMIAVSIFKEIEIDGDLAWLCDSWLMSCRVLKRRVEEAVLKTAVEAARAAGIAKIYGDYLPTAKNGMVEKHFEGLGFQEVGPLDGGGTRWVLALDSYEAPDLPMDLHVEISDLVAAQ